MAISTSQLGIGARKRNIASRLESQASDLQDTPWWKTLGSVALPFAATAAMPWLGGLMMGGSGFLGGLGTALTSTGGAGGAMPLLKGLLAKGTFQHLFKTGGRELMDLAEGKSASDINVGTDPLDIALGREAQEKMRSDYRSAKAGERRTDLIGTVTSAVESQGGYDAFKEAMGAEQAAGAVRGAGTLDELLEVKGQHTDALTALKGANPDRFAKLFEGASANLSGTGMPWSQQYIDKIIHGIEQAIPEDYTNPLFNVPTAPTLGPGYGMKRGGRVRKNKKSLLEKLIELEQSNNIRGGK